MQDVHEEREQVCNEPSRDASTQNSIVDNTAANITDAGGVLYLFSGPLRPDDGLEKFLEDHKLRCACVDREVNELHDLLDQSTWEEWLKRLTEFDAFMLSPPCSTFTPARGGRGGPQPLRSACGPDRYGFKWLGVEDKRKAREGNVLALRAHAVAEHAMDRKAPWILEQPHEREGKTSMFKLDEFIELMQKPAIYRYTFAQCRYGAEAEKLTDLVSNIAGMDEFTLKCNHPKQWWVIPWSGERVLSPHPPLRGKQRAIAERDWNQSMLRDKEPHGDYLTRQAAAYPTQLNRALAAALHKAIRERPGGVATEVDRSGHGKHEVDPRPVMTLKLSAAETHQKQEEDIRNGLRDVHCWVTDRMKYIGVQVRRIIEQEFALDQAQQDLWLNITEHKEQHELKTPHSFLRTVRARFLDLLVRNSDGKVAPEVSIDEIDTPECSTVIRAYLLQAWAVVVDDPAAKVARWLIEGAPAGLQGGSDFLDGVFPRVDDAPSDIEPGDLFTAFEEFENYAGVEQDQEAYDTLERYREKGYLRRFDSRQQLENYLGAAPVLSKLACIKKLKYNADTEQYVHKSRIILDCKRSGVSEVASRTHKSVLPRITDAVRSALELLDTKTDDQVVTLFIADIVDAFWLIPLHFSERKYFCARLRNKWYVYTRTAQGSRMAPLTFAAVMALASRWIQSLGSDFRLQTYVDDPLVVLRTKPEEVKQVATTIAAAWLIMGFPIAFHKATLKTDLTWIGVHLAVEEEKVVAKVTEEKVVELTDLLTAVLEGNVVTKKVLRSVIGKAMSIASVIYVWRPFIQQMYTALHSEEGHAPSGCIWVKQIQHACRWLLTFLAGEQAGITREFTLAAYRRQGQRVTITWDASPYGMGATLQIEGRFVEFFAIRISQLDQEYLETPAGDSRGQQVWEALTGLIALRQWQQHWQHQHAVLQVRNDNTGALTLFATLKAGSSALAVIAREFALDLGKATCRPLLIQHIPGVTNQVCDSLSRINDPSCKFKLPVILTGAKAVMPPKRDAAWWKSLPQRWVRSTPARPEAGDGERIRSRSARRSSG